MMRWARWAICSRSSIIHARVANFLHFVQKHLRVNHHAIAHQTGRVGIKNAGGNEMNLELAEFVNDRVPGVVAAVIARDKVGVARK